MSTSRIVIPKPQGQQLSDSICIDQLVHVYVVFLGGLHTRSRQTVGLRTVVRGRTYLKFHHLGKRYTLLLYSQEHCDATTKLHKQGFKVPDPIRLSWFDLSPSNVAVILLIA